MIVVGSVHIEVELTEDTSIITVPWLKCKAKYLLLKPQPICPLLTELLQRLSHLVNLVKNSVPFDRGRGSRLLVGERPY